MGLNLLQDTAGYFIYTEGVFVFCFNYFKWGLNSHFKSLKSVIYRT